LDESDDLIPNLIAAHIYECPDLKQKYIDDLTKGRQGLEEQQLMQMKDFPELLVQVTMALK